MAFLVLLFLPRKSNGNTKLPSLFINIDLYTRIARARMGYGVWAAYMGLRIYGVDLALSFRVSVFALLFLGKNSNTRKAITTHTTTRQADCWYWHAYCTWRTAARHVYCK